MKKYIEFTLFRVFLTSISTLLMACGSKGPSVTDCTPRSTNLDFKCHNESNGNTTNVPAAKLENWIFVSAADQRSIQTACANSSGWPLVTACSFDPKQMHFICFNEWTQKTSLLLFSESEKFGLSGVSSVDEQILLEFCESRAKAKVKDEKNRKRGPLE